MFCSFYMKHPDIQVRSWTRVLHSFLKSKLLREGQKSGKWKNTLHNRSDEMWWKNAELLGQAYKFRQAISSLEGVSCFKTSDHNFFACTQWWEAKIFLDSLCCSSIIFSCTVPSTKINQHELSLRFLSACLEKKSTMRQAISSSSLLNLPNLLKKVFTKKS